jgi:hypothetical protein
MVWAGKRQPYRDQRTNAPSRRERRANTLRQNVLAAFIPETPSRSMWLGNRGALRTKSGLYDGFLWAKVRVWDLLDCRRSLEGLKLGNEESSSFKISLWLQGRTWTKS